MTYNVFGGTLSLTLSIYLEHPMPLRHFCNSSTIYKYHYLLTVLLSNHIDVNSVSSNV